MIRRKTNSVEEITISSLDDPSSHLEKEAIIQTKKAEILNKILENPSLIIRSTGGLSLYESVQYFWDEISQDPFKDNWHIEYLCKELEIVAYRVANRKPKLYDLVINIPPGMTKTIIMLIMFPVWCWMNWYWMRLITCSYSAALSLESAEHSRDLIRSQKFQDLYPELEIKEDKDTKGNYRVVKKEYVAEGKVPRIHKGGNRFSTSVGGALTGFHGHILLIDDPLDPRQAASEKELSNVIQWMTQTLPTRKTDKEATPIILIMQRLAEGDPSGVFIKRKNVKHICLPGELKHYREHVSPPELVKFYKDGLLDPVRLNWKTLSELEDNLGQYGYAGQIGQSPSPPEGGMFKVDNFKILATSLNFVNHQSTVRYWDKAGTENAGAYTTGVKLTRLTNNRILIEDVIRGQWASEQRERIIRQTAEKDGRDVIVLVEQEPGSGGKESAENTIRNLAGFVVYADLPKGNKVFRADPFSVQVNNGNVLLIPAEWNDSYINEFRYFPHGNYKDQVDASSAGFNYLMKKKIARRIT